MSKGQKCLKCASTLIYIRIKTGEVVCRNCGHIGKKKREKEEVSEEDRCQE